MTSPTFWLIVGFLGQGAVHGAVPGPVDGLGEEARRGGAGGVLVAQPAGRLALLSYAISRRDPVIIVGQAMGLFVYVRNLMLVGKAARRQARREMRSRGLDRSRGHPGRVLPRGGCRAFAPFRPEHGRAGGHVVARLDPAVGPADLDVIGNGSRVRLGPTTWVALPCRPGMADVP